MKFVSIAVAFCLSLSVSWSQLRVSGQASTAFLKADAGQTQYSVNSGRGTFAWRIDLFADAVITDNIFFLSNFRMLQDQVPHIDLFALKITDIASSGLNLEAGEIELPFGNLGERRFPKTNPFFSLPLFHEHLTSLRSSDYALWLSDARYTSIGNGVRLLDQGLYDLGIKVYGGIGIFDYWVAVINGMVSSTSTYSASYGSAGLNATGGFGKLIRLAVTPVTGLTLGGSYAAGPFIKESNYYQPEFHSSEYPQQIAEADIDFAIDHFTFYGEGMYNVWKFSSALGSDLRASGYSVEGKYTPLPRISFAVRAGQLFFNRVTVNTVQGPYGVQRIYGRWDQDVFRLEGALGYRIDRSALMKFVYQWNRTLGVTDDPADNVVAAQLVFGF